MDALNKLIEAVEAGNLHQQRYGGMPMATACYPRDEKGNMLPDKKGWSDRDVLCAYHGSLDAAKALHEALLPGVRYLVGADEQGWPDEFGAVVFINPKQTCTSETPARAWLLAILRARAAQSEGEA